MGETKKKEKGRLEEKRCTLYHHKEEKESRKARKRRRVG